MINKNKNVRLQLTISKKQFQWLDKFAKNKGITISKLVAWLLNKKSKEVTDAVNLNDHPQEEIEKVSDEEMDEILTKFEELRAKNKNKF